RVMDEALNKRISLLEIITGKGSGELKKRVLRFLDQPGTRQLYHRVEKDDKNFGRIFVHFKPMSHRKKIGLYGYPPPAGR
ncbi:MAG: Smr/MutS family protein, partial [Candidatus Omnitrophota bacterium]